MKLRLKTLMLLLSMGLVLSGCYKNFWYKHPEVMHFNTKKLSLGMSTQSVLEVNGIPNSAKEYVNEIGEQIEVWYYKELSISNMPAGWTTYYESITTTTTLTFANGLLRDVKETSVVNPTTEDLDNLLREQCQNPATAQQVREIYLR